MSTWPPNTHQDVQDNVTFARTHLFPAAARYVALGDSITIAGDSAANNTYSNSYPHYLSLLSAGRIILVRNAGVGGDQTSNMISRFSTDVTPYAPTLVSVLAGQNDMTFGVTDATYRANIKTLVELIRGIGAQPLLFTMTPVDTFAAADKQRVMRNNIWITMYCEQQGIICVDAYSQVVDPATSGNYLPAMTGASNHPSSLGYAAIGTAAWNSLAGLLPKPTPFRIAPSQLDTLNMVSNGLFLSGATGWSQNWGPSTRSVSDGVTTASSTTITSATANFASTDVGVGISGGSIPAGATIASVTNTTTAVLSAAATTSATAVSITIGGTASSSVVADSNMPGGQAFRITLSRAGFANDHATWHQSITTGFSVGDVIRASCLVNSSGTVGPQFNIVSTSSGGSYRDDHRFGYKDATAALLSMEFTVASGTTALDVNLTANTRDSGTGAGTGTVDFGAVTLINKTTNNLLTV